MNYRINTDKEFKQCRKTTGFCNVTVKNIR